MRGTITALSIFFLLNLAIYTQRTELSQGWKAKRVSETELSGEELTINFFPDSSWISAAVPGTVLTMLLDNGLIPDPFIGMNNALIPDISEVGPDYYTYWFHNVFFTQDFPADQQVWLEFRGVNYACDIYLNGHRLTSRRHEGMFLRQRYNVTRYITQGANNRLAVAVYPPDLAGIPNGGQGGDGTIARNVTMQFTAGWDWTEPVADRNTGIWDKVFIEITGPVDIFNPRVTTRLKGVRTPGEIQDPAMITFSAELHNSSGSTVVGELGAQLANLTGKTKVKIPPGETVTVSLKPLKMKQPRLWWPNGTGSSTMYTARLYFQTGKDKVSDIEQVRFGIRELSTEFDEKTGARVFYVNGQKIFIKGGNWIASDAMLRLSEQRYADEISMIAAMNMNMLRVWGGSITERPEFYKACDDNGIMVWQDLWITGDCNGRWTDPKKSDNREGRREYPDNHDLFIKSVADQVKMLRNHPSLVLWCGGNEFPPPPGIDSYLRDSLFPSLDPERLYLSESTGSQLMKNPYGGTGDGPYNLMKPSWFFTYKSFPFNAEIGSVGLPVEETLRKILTPGALTIPDENNLDPEWRFHKYLPYKDFPARYGPVKDFSDFVMKAQMVNYEQYRAMQEGQNAKMWEWYTGMLVWKTQNPWTSLRGQFYDTWFEPNAGYYGYMHAAKPFHAQVNLDDTTLCVVNATPRERRETFVRYSVHDLSGRIVSSFDTTMLVAPASVNRIRKIELPAGKSVVFVKLLMENRVSGEVIDENVYWMAAGGADYSALEDLGETDLNVEIFRVSGTVIDINITNRGKLPAVFVRFRINNVVTDEVLAPVFFEDNYITLMPGEKRFVRADLSVIPSDIREMPLVLHWKGFNIPEKSRTF
jgi:hypothetical protein